MDRKVLILPGDGGEIFERVLGTTSSGELERHATGIQSILDKKGQNIQGMNKMLDIVWLLI